MKNILIIVFIFLSFAQNAGAVFTMTVTGGSPVAISPTMIGDDNFSASPIDLTCQSDQGNPWEIQIYAASDLRNSRSQELSIENLKWYGAYEDGTSGSFIKGTGGESIALSLDPDAVYSDSGAAGAVVNVQVGLGVEVPVNQPQGTYRTTVRFLMTE